ncbi:MAG: hypothetical protein MEQ84_11720 [Mesorhizobium sp.]|nr:hypothetical protein [Mesorhizobium sp.]
MADLEYRVEVWDERDLHVVEIVAASGNLLVARAAFDAALKDRPEQNLRLRHRARVIREFVPGG